MYVYELREGHSTLGYYATEEMAKDAGMEHALDHYGRRYIKTWQRDSAHSGWMLLPVLTDAGLRDWRVGCDVSYSEKKTTYHLVPHVVKGAVA